MKRLLLLRHAKSSWADEGLADHDRPLAPRGRRASEAIARHLESEDISPQLVLCSSARRTRETLELVGLRGEARIEPELYGAGQDALLERLRRLPDDLDSVMVIAHNPGIQELTLRLADGGERIADVERKFPTAALATLTFDGSWRELGPSAAVLAGFVTPKRLGRA